MTFCTNCNGNRDGRRKLCASVAVNGFSKGPWCHCNCNRDNKINVSVAVAVAVAALPFLSH